jgi:hypothetical protein
MNEREQEKCRLRPEWVQWWRDHLRVMRHDDRLINSSGSIYRVDQESRTVILAYGQPEQPIIDRRCIEAAGYKYEVFLDPTEKVIEQIKKRDPQTTILIELASGKTLVRRPIKPHGSHEES